MIPADRVHPSTFVGANKKFKVIPWSKIHRQKHNKEKTEEQRAKIVERLVSNEEKKRQQLKELGIDYDFPGYSAKAKKPKLIEEAKVEIKSKKSEPVKQIKEKAVKEKVVKEKVVKEKNSRK